MPKRLFLSTLSLRRATPTQPLNTLQSSDFYPRSPCGERPLYNYIITYVKKFLSTLSLRRATYSRLCVNLIGIISIHALLAESDHKRWKTRQQDFYFYPRSPCGERQALGLLGWLRVLISIHALLAESDLINTYHRIFGEGISIHALLAESDFIMTITICIVLRFLSTLSLRRATSSGNSCTQALPISIHALLAESDATGFPLSKATIISIHALLAESDPRQPKIHQ